MEGFDCSARPFKSDFVARHGAEFRVSRLGGEPLGVLKLAAVRDLTSPDADGLRELECFGLTFECVEMQVLAQGTYLLEEGDFRVALFLIPESPTRMDAVIN